jgi:hypothetical protein
MDNLYWIALSKIALGLLGLYFSVFGKEKLDIWLRVVFLLLSLLLIYVGIHQLPKQVEQYLFPVLVVISVIGFIAYIVKDLRESRML